MAVHTSIFGGVCLTDEDARTFRKQIAEQRPPREAKESLEKGRELLAEFKENGFVRIKLNK